MSDESRRFQGLVEAGKEDRKAIDELVDENLQLRGLLRKCQPYFTRGAAVRLDEKALKRLLKEIQKAVGDEA